MFTFLVQHLKSSNFDAMVGVARLEKGVEKAAYRTGADSLAQNLPYTIEGQRIDIVCWRRELDEGILDKKLQSIVKAVWNKSWNVTEGDKYAA